MAIQFGAVPHFPGKIWLQPMDRKEQLHKKALILSIKDLFPLCASSEQPTAPGKCSAEISREN